MPDPDSTPAEETDLRPLSPADEPAAAPTAEPTAAPAADSHTADSIAPASTEEIRKLSRALRHAARGAGKHEAIYVGWGRKRGGGPQYKRAEALFDLALKAMEDANEC
jgi:hypothetical protein